MMQARSDWVDCAKAIGIVLVVYAHVARGIRNAGLPLDEQLHRLVDSVIYSFHMPLFFALSGLFFFRSLHKRGVGGLIASKLDVIVWPYILWSLIQGGLEAGLAPYTNGGTSYGEVLAFIWQPRAHFWFLYALFLVFAAAALLFSVVPRRGLPAVFAISILLYLLPTWFYPGYYLYLICSNFVFFVFGALLGAGCDDDTALSTPSAVLVTGAIFAVLQYNFHGQLGLTYQNTSLLTLGLAVVSILFVVSVSQWLARRPNKLILHLGACSLGIYLMHVIAGGGVRVLLFQGLGVESVAVHLTLGTLVGLGAPLLATLLIRKYGWHWFLVLPISRTLRGLRLGRLAPSSRGWHRPPGEKAGDSFP